MADKCFLCGLPARLDHPTDPGGRLALDVACGTCREYRITHAAIQKAAVAGADARSYLSRVTSEHFAATGKPLLITEGMVDAAIDSGREPAERHPPQ